MAARTTPGRRTGWLHVDPGIDTSGDWPLAVLGTLASQLSAIVAGVGPSDSDQRYSALGRRVAELVEAHRG